MRSISRNWSPVVLDISAAVVVLAITGYAWFLWDNEVMSKWLPFSSLMVLGNWFPIGAAAMAAVVSNRLKDQGARRALPMGAMLCVGGFSAVYLVLGAAPQCGDLWSADGICFQTTQKTCSAACAATLLGQYGLPASEQEMAELCFTRKGTSWKGIYRGLKLKTAGTDLQVNADKISFEQLAKLDRPVLIQVGIQQWEAIGNAHGIEAEEGWTPGTMHSVICLGVINESQVLIADPNPSIGIEIWPRESLERLWQGKALYFSTEDASHAGLIGNNLRDQYVIR
ncbi:cysteine peptidase family C39 domain-containing protein [Blastopirellula sp. JC732]|uniref:Cysteine peptidase family C39 domain-containing protein n=1 Tax=Blastopirellula sediminis TaxID=2894196 RepID=A0A9X1SG28_9BACT|nr:cysteine peptidase family C39 domain-containing protein [Blastopirellula sediminis]MCC9609719.1 cysteine peptidase family C39 domain-containing protein [Blastopirellula sediminis]MCC9628963.1 cysteine peptidase family C39 domain-containing protein [Blastopirellula sediminis]